MRRENYLIDLLGALILVSYLIQDGAKKAGWAHAKGPGRIGGRSKLCKERKFISCYFWLQLNHKTCAFKYKDSSTWNVIIGCTILFWSLISSIRRHLNFEIILNKVKVQSNYLSQIRQFLNQTFELIFQYWLSVQAVLCILIVIQASHKYGHNIESYILYIRRHPANKELFVQALCTPLRSSNCTNSFVSRWNNPYFYYSSKYLFKD